MIPRRDLYDGQLSLSLSLWLSLSVIMTIELKLVPVLLRFENALQNLVR